MAECKDVIGEASGVGVMLLDPQIGLMVEQAIENMATDPSYFYDVPNPTSLTGIFQRIASDLAGGSSRIVE